MTGSHERGASWQLVACVVLVVALVHAPSLGAPLLGDDYRLIARVSTDGQADLARVIADATTPLGDRPGPRFWRPLWQLSFWLDLTLWGPRPAGFHATNLALHALAAVALGRLALALGLAPRAALAVACLFAGWPTHHEAVPWIAARCGPMATGLTIAALGWALKGRTRLATGAALLAMLSKETGFIVAPLCAAAVALCEGPRVALRRTGPMWLGAGLCLAARTWILGTPVGGYPQVPLSPLRPDFVAAQANTLGSLLGGVRADLFGAAVPLVAGLALAAILCLGAWRRRDEHRNAWRLALTWAVLAWVPISPFLVSPIDQADSRFLYGLVAPLSLALVVALGRLGLPTWRLVAGVLVLAVLNQGPRRDAEALADQLFPRIQALAMDGAGTLVVLAGVPDRPGGVVVGRNAFPDALRPLYTDQLLARPALVLTDTPEGRARLRGLLDATAQDADARVLTWDSGSGVFVDLPR